MSVVDLSSFAGLKVLAGSTVVTCGPLQPFSEISCDFLAALSRALLSNERAKRYSDVVSFAYWCRKANIQREKDIRNPHLEGRLGRGLAFHIAPSNIPVNFAYTYAFSLLAGNATIVRCPTKAFDQARVILDAMETLFPHYEDIARRSSFVSYPSASDITAQLSLLADTRVIWGGDDTVAFVRSLRAKPRCIDVMFADRYSIAVLAAPAVNNLDEKGLALLARGFYNDTYLMDQNACSSPQTVFWIGSDDEVAAARNVFWHAVHDEAKARYDLQPAVSVDKHVHLCGDVIAGFSDETLEDDGLVVLARISDSQAPSARLRGVGGYFYEKEVSSIAELVGFVDEKYQTLVYFGLDAQSVRNDVISCGMMGIDRIVPVGSALDIGLVWDGSDLIETLSRVIIAE